MSNDLDQLRAAVAAAEEIRRLRAENRRLLVLVAALWAGDLVSKEHADPTFDMRRAAEIMGTRGREGLCALAERTSTRGRALVEGERDE